LFQFSTSKLGTYLVESQTMCRQNI